MENRKKLDLLVNSPVHIKLLSDCKEGESQYGKYFLYTVSNGEDKEYSFFAPDAVHSVLKDHGKGTEAIITKLAAQRGKKLVTTYDVQIVDSKNDVELAHNQPQTNPHLDAMIQSFEDAIKIQDRFNGMANVNQIAITMFIQRTKSNGFSNQ